MERRVTPHPADATASGPDPIPHLGDSLARLDPELGNPTRLGLVASLRHRDRAEFRLLKGSLGISDSVLSRHISALESAGLLTVHKGYVGKRPRTWVSITDAGRRRLEDHVQALHELAGE